MKRGYTSGGGVPHLEAGGKAGVHFQEEGVLLL